MKRWVMPQTLVATSVVLLLCGCGDDGGTEPTDIGPSADQAAETTPVPDVATDAESPDVSPEVGDTAVADETPCETCGGDGCVDLQTSGDHCGECSNPCLLGQACLGGTCGCPEGTTACSDYGICRSVDDDPLFCGDCDTICEPLETCEQGDCVCPATYTPCGDFCVDTATDEWHCNGCDQPCPLGEKCVDGNCEAPVFDTYPPFLQLEGPLSIAHRGGRRLAPENTLVAFHMALLQYDVDVLEMDTHMTADGVLVTIHDETVDRTTDGTGAIAEMTLAEVQALDAGYRFSEDGGDTWPWRGQGVIIPTLEDVFGSFPADVPMNIELKAAGYEEAFVQLVVDTGKLDSICSGSFEDGSAETLRQAFLSIAGEPGCVWFPVGASLCRVQQTANDPPDFTQCADFDVLAINMDFVGAVDMLATTDTWDLGDLFPGIPIHVWTINNPADMLWLLERNVHGLMSDYPDRLQRAFQAVGVGD